LSRLFCPSVCLSVKRVDCDKTKKLVLNYDWFVVCLALCACIFAWLLRPSVLGCQLQCNRCLETVIGNDLSCVDWVTHSFSTIQNVARFLCDIEMSTGRVDPRVKYSRVKNSRKGAELFISTQENN